MYFLRYSFYTLCFLFRIALGHALSKRKAARLLSEIEIKFNGKLDPKTFEKAITFQSIQQFLVNDNFTQLYNRKTNKIENTHNRLYFLLAFLYDDLLDENRVSKEEINTLFLDPYKAQPSGFNEFVLVYTHQKLYDYVQNKEAYQQVLNNIHLAQLDSIQQKDKKITLEEIILITKRKGGNSLLMCYFYLQIPMIESIENCWYELGGLIQMSNDLYDVFKDLQEGIFTFANTQNNYDQIKEIYISQINNFRNTVALLPFSTSKKMRFNIILSLIPSLGLVALDNLKKIKDSDSNLPDLKLVPRKILIVDNQKIKNIISIFRYSYFLGNPNNIIKNRYPSL